MTEKLLLEFKKLAEECNSVKGIECIEKFRERRSRFWELAGHFDYYGLKNRCLESNTLTDEDMCLVSFITFLTVSETISRKIELESN